MIIIIVYSGENMSNDKNNSEKLENDTPNCLNCNTPYNKFVGHLNGFDHLECQCGGLDEIPCKISFKGIDCDACGNEVIKCNNCNRRVVKPTYYYSKSDENSVYHNICLTKLEKSSGHYRQVGDY
jgi:hypothetical protein